MGPPTSTAWAQAEHGARAAAGRLRRDGQRGWPTAMSSVITTDGHHDSQTLVGSQLRPNHQKVQPCTAEEW